MDERIESFIAHLARLDRAIREARAVADALAATKENGRRPPNSGA